MKKLLIVLTFISGNLFAVNADDIVGLWLMEPNKKGIQYVVDVFEMNGKFYANGIANTGSSITNHDKDLKNPDPALRTRLKRDIVFIYELEFNGSEWVNGEVYDINTGNYYHMKVEKPSADILKFRASTDKTGIFGKTLTWTKVPNPAKYTPYKHTPEFLKANLPTERKK